MASGILLGILIISASFNLITSVEVDPAVYADLEKTGTTRVIIYSKHEPLEASKEIEINDNGIRSEYFATLHDTVTRRQTRIIQYLSKNKDLGRPGSQFTSLWAFNAIAVRDANQRVIEDLKGFEEVVQIRTDRYMKLIQPPETGTDEHETQAFDHPVFQNPNWNVRQVGAEEAWSAGYSGQGVVVGIIDTGIRSSHKILRGRLRKNYSWFDAVNGRADPYDDGGHGTHCAGTIAGGDGYGIAPDVTLVACKAFNYTGSAFESWLLACGQFMLCPTDPAGKNADCSKAPKIISNSWGAVGGDHYFDKVTDAWVANNQIAIFAAGNSGEKCGTMASPADYAKAIAVGATNFENKMATFSSRGPGRDSSAVKPDIAAPGEDIVSAGHKSDDEFTVLSGTSMATPLVAGAAAIYCSKNITLTQEDVREKLKAGAVRISSSYFRYDKCDPRRNATGPNHHAGYGRIVVPTGLKSEIRVVSFICPECETRTRPLLTNKSVDYECVPCGQPGYASYQPQNFWLKVGCSTGCGCFCP